MEEQSKAIIEATVHEAAAPYRRVAEALLGYAFLDALEEKREIKKLQRLKNRAGIAKEALLQLGHRKVDPEESGAAPEHVEGIMDAGEETSVPELQQLFGRLLAATLDPKRRGLYRKEFAGIAKQFEPLEAALLQEMAMPGIGGGQWIQQVGTKISRSGDEIFVSGLNLERLGLIQPINGHPSIQSSAFITPLGRQFLKCVAD